MPLLARPGEVHDGIRAFTGAELAFLALSVVAAVVAAAWLVRVRLRRRRRGAEPEARS